MDAWMLRKTVFLLCSGLLRRSRILLVHLRRLDRLDGVSVGIDQTALEVVPHLGVAGECLGLADRAGIHGLRGLSTVIALVQIRHALLPTLWLLHWHGDVPLQVERQRHDHAGVQLVRLHFVFLQPSHAERKGVHRVIDDELAVADVILADGQLRMGMRC